ncbi:hypothetical protein CAOG_07412 [Capsaspora owczarzaki ATCC 30864]|uniref:SART-1 protein n=1 Tax=Capsaspora owczarzaki (strain ATCC 30864) TaxID=595528 RepID=A0A0D2X5C7_CAPO3|nr:hypothetical protein CAOG_07412 [Capsaspora owczarzaki ATCC 30864]KJE97579.1 hypothetical protein CAOG_007412 [Capsaspora owczarzaki ATCC 30864]|eukprot:XP_004343271.1 hypothetical protein CAOG_07412 [Capsaspora owczarzaki ATCC 30864]
MSSESVLSIEETNAQRAALGLKPLKLKAANNADDASASDQPAAPALSEDERRDIAAFKFLEEQAQIQKEKDAKTLEERLAAHREARRIEDSLKATKTLGAADKEGDSASSWVTQSRKAQDAQRKAAEARLRAFDELDEQASTSIGSSKPKPAQKKAAATGAQSYDSSNLAGLKVAHDVEDFEEGSTVLVLQDTGVLDDDNEDVLENVNMADHERAKQNAIRRANSKRPGYNPLVGEDGNDSGLGAPTGLLSHYDEWEEELKGDRKLKKLTVLDAQGSADTAEKKLEQEFFAKQRAKAVSLDSDTRTSVSDFYTPEEMISFKKPSKDKKHKKRRTRDRTQDADDDEDDSIATQQSASGVVRSKRKAPSGEDGEDEDDVQPAVTVRHLLNNSQAMDTSSSASGPDRGSRKRGRHDDDEHSEATISLPEPGQFQALKPVTDASFDFVADDEGEVELARALERTRRLKQQAEGFLAGPAVPAVRPKSEDSTEDSAASAGDSSLVFSATSEFVKNIGARDLKPDPVQTQPAKPASFVPALVSQAQQPAGVTAPMDIVSVGVPAANRTRRTKLVGDDEAEAMDTQPIKKEESKSDDKNDFQDFLTEEPSLVNGVGAALAFMARRGMIENESKAQGVVVVETDRQRDKGKQRMDQEEERKIELEIRRQREAERNRDRRDRRDVRDSRSDRDRNDRPPERDREADPFSMPAPEFTLDYVDENGRTMTTKEAFNHLSYKFHGIQPGKNKQEKRQRKLEEEVLIKQMAAGDTPLHTRETTYKKMQEAGQAFVVISGGPATQSSKDAARASTSSGTATSGLQSAFSGFSTTRK